MTHKEMAKGLLRQAESSLESAKRAADDGNWAFAVRTSQDASELSIKALLLATGDEPPKVHDLGKALHENRDDLQKLGLDGSEVHKMARMARSLAEDRSKSLYGDEKKDIPATKLYEQQDARDAYTAASDIYSKCRGVVEQEF
jgi:HEPN domain-containing protein